MFNPANLANEVFGILRSFDYVVNIFDFDGNRVYEPSDARRFFASPKNITVSIHEDGENSSVKLFLSKSTEVSEVSGLISTMRVTASKFGVLFNVRKYERELKPKDLAPNGASEFESGVSLSSAENPNSGDDNGPAKELDFRHHVHSPEGDKLDRIDGEVSTLTKDFKEIVGLLRSKKVKESMSTNETVLNENDGETVHLEAFDMDVEADAWAGFLKGYLKFDTAPNLDITDDDVAAFAAKYAAAHDGIEIDHATAVRATELDRVITAIAKTTPLLAAVFQKCIKYIASGNSSRLVDTMVKKAVEARSHGVDAGDNFHAVPDAKADVKKGADMVTIKEFRGQVERAAWQDFVNEHIDLSGNVEFEGRKFGPSANKLAIMLGMVAEKTKAAGLANLFSAFADAIDSGKATPFKTKVAKHAIEIAKHGKVDVGESLIVTESIKEFGDWFDSLSSTNMFGHVLAENADCDSEAVCKCIDECHCDKEPVLQEEPGEDIVIADIDSDEDAGAEDITLSTEDVLLPSRADDDLSREVVAQHDGDDMDRIIALARGTSATYSPRTPQP